MNKAPAFATRVLLAIAAMVVIAPPSWAQPGAPTAAATDTTPSPGPFAPVTVRGGGFGAAGQFVISGELELSIV